MSAKKTALGIAHALADVETAIDSGDTAASQEKVKELHAQLRKGLKKHGHALGLTDADIAEIDNAGPMARSGEPKE